MGKNLNSHVTKETSKNEAQSEHGCERQGLSALT